MWQRSGTDLTVCKNDAGVFFYRPNPSTPKAMANARADSVIWLRAGHMALYLVRRSHCVAALFFFSRYLSLSGMLELSDWD